ncbi:MAG: cytochrome P450 [Actinomycetota bacterium]
MTDTALEQLLRILPGDSDLDHDAVFARLRREDPVARCEAIDGWVVTRWTDVTRVFEDAEHFIPMAAGSGSSGIYGRTILHMTGVEHRRKAAILGRRMRNTRRLGGDIRSLVSELVQEFGAALPAAPTVADVKGDFTALVPLAVIGELMTMREATAFPDWYHRIVAASVSNVTGDPEVHARGVAARDDLFEWLTPEIVAKRDDPGDDLLSDLCTIEFEGEALTDDEIRSFCAFLLSAGIETTDRALVNLCCELIAHPEQWRRLQADRSLVPSAVAEILRHRPPVQASIRQAAVDVELAGVTIPAGEKVMVLLSAANHDEDVFTDPDRFDVGRFADDAGAQFTPAGANRGFGGGAHTCTGSLLAKLEMECALTYLLDHCTHMTHAADPPPMEGFVLRSPSRLELHLHRT